MTYSFVLVLYLSYPVTMFYTDILSCVTDLDKYSRMPYNIRGDCMSWQKAQQSGYVVKTN
jgi:hypothetical protein